MHRDIKNYWRNLNIFRVHIHSIFFLAENADMMLGSSLFVCRYIGIKSDCFIKLFSYCDKT